MMHRSVNQVSIVVGYKTPMCGKVHMCISPGLNSILLTKLRQSLCRVMFPCPGRHRLYFADGGGGLERWDVF